MKRIKVQQSKPTVTCEERALKNVWSFIYLGAKFSADGNHLTDVKARIAIVTKTDGKMRHDDDPTTPENADLHCGCLVSARN